MKTFTTLSQAKKETGLSYLGSINSSSKIVKNGKLGVDTYILYLAPSNLSGYEVCPNATKECRLGCLATSGRNIMDINSGRNIINNSRITKTKLFFEEREFFMNWLVAEISKAKLKSESENKIFSVRLNGTSDIDWVNVRFGIDNKNIFEIFPTVQFYDYTKNVRKFNNKPSNYHLTFSYTGLNSNECNNLLKLGHNIAVVFNGILPEEFLKHKVINGDETDVRFLDESNVIVGLKWKNIADKKLNTKLKTTSKFVVNI